MIIYQPFSLPSSSSCNEDRAKLLTSYKLKLKKVLFGCCLTKSQKKNMECLSEELTLKCKPKGGWGRGSAKMASTIQNTLKHSSLITVEDMMGGGCGCKKNEEKEGNSKMQRGVSE